MYGRSSATPEARVRVLYDGWPLAYDPGSPPSLHLLEILALLSGEVEALIAAPAPVSLPAGLVSRILVLPRQAGARSRLVWEQLVLPRLARQQRAHVLHLAVPYAPIIHPIKTLVSPAGWFPQGGLDPGAGSRLRAAFGRSGLSGSTILWPGDLPTPEKWGANLKLLPPTVHPAFIDGESSFADSTAANWPDPFVFAPGPVDEDHLPDLLAAWSWASAGLGEDCPLVVASAPQTAQTQADWLREKLNIKSSVIAVDCSTPQETAQAFRKAEVVLVLGDCPPWGDPLLQSLAVGKGPAVLIPANAAQQQWVEARVGPAAYLANDLRTLGAAVLTLAIENTVNEALKEAARLRAASWKSERFRTELMNTYLESA